jgi:hypothetical protein
MAVQGHRPLPAYEKAQQPATLLRGRQPLCRLGDVVRDIVQRRIPKTTATFADGTWWSNSS